MEDNKCILKNTCGLFTAKGECKYITSNNCYLCNRLFRLNKLYEGALLTNQQRTYIDLYYDGDGTDEENFHELDDLSKNVVDFINKGKNLYIYSTTCGNGKTSWALRFIQRYFGSIWKTADINKCHALFINVPRFLLALKDNISERSEYISYIKENIWSADIVVWDDIGTKSITTFEAENLLSMIDMRMNDNKSNIFTSNMTNEELYGVLGQRLASRIINFSVNERLQGRDKRKYKIFGGD